MLQQQVLQPLDLLAQPFEFPAEHRHVSARGPRFDLLFPLGQEFFLLAAQYATARHHLPASMAASFARRACPILRSNSRMPGGVMGPATTGRSVASVRAPIMDLGGAGPERGEDLGGEPAAFPDEPEQDVLAADVHVAQADRLAQRQFQHPLGPRGERDVPGRLLLALADNGQHLLPRGFPGDPGRVQRPGGYPVVSRSRPSRMCSVPM